MVWPSTTYERKAHSQTNMRMETQWQRKRGRSRKIEWRSRELLERGLEENLWETREQWWLGFEELSKPD